jgi:hypothetical protein
MTKYKFIGAGMGVPGLPHEITDEQAKADGVDKLLDQAVTLGLYEEVKEPVKGQKSKVEPLGSKGDVNDG